jgi:hypothetical protein
MIFRAAQVQGKKSENTKENKVAADFTYTLCLTNLSALWYIRKNESNDLSSIGG